MYPSVGENKIVDIHSEVCNIHLLTGGSESMKTPTEILNRYGADPTHVWKAVRDVRVLMDEQADPIKFAAKLVSELTGQVIMFADVDEARIVTQCTVQSLLKGEVVDFDSARAKAVSLRTTHPWAFLKDADDAEPKPGRKGGAEQKARALYLEHVIQAKTPLKRIEFIKLLVKEGVMASEAGASTYHSKWKKYYEENKP